KTFRNALIEQPDAPRAALLNITRSWACREFTRSVREGRIACGIARSCEDALLVHAQPHVELVEHVRDGTGEPDPPRAPPSHVQPDHPTSAVDHGSTRIARPAEQRT